MIIAEGCKQFVDLLYYDGPLLTVFEDEAGHKYLTLWYDVLPLGEDLWFVFEITDENLAKLTSPVPHAITLLEAMKQAPKLFIAPGDALFGDWPTLTGNEISISSIPEEDLPAVDSYLYPA